MSDSSTNFQRLASKLRASAIRSLAGRVSREATDRMAAAKCGTKQMSMCHLITSNGNKEVGSEIVARIDSTEEIRALICESASVRVVLSN